MYANKEIELTSSWLLDQLTNSIEQQFSGKTSGYEKYCDDPVGFGEDILGDSYTNDVKRLMESVRDYPVTVARSANATGKTHAAARIAIHYYSVFQDAQVYTAAAPPESNLKKLLWGEIGGVADKFPDVFKDSTATNLHIARSPQSFITGVTIPMSGTGSQKEAKFSGKHAPHLMFIVDEGDAVPDEVYKGIESCMSGGHARLLIMFNPRHESGHVCRLIRDGMANVVDMSAFSHPSVISGKEEIPGAVTRDVTIRRINEWTRPLNAKEKPDTECFELPKFLESETALSQAGVRFPPLVPGWYKVTQPEFSYMVLGQYPAQGSTQLISREWIANARSRWDAYVIAHGESPPLYTSGVMGLDVGEYGSDANAAIFRYGGFVERPVCWQGVNLASTADRAADEYKARLIVRCCVDATGVGAGVAPAMQRHGCMAIPVKVANTPTDTSEIGDFRILRDQLWWKCREWLRADHGSMLPPDEMLIEELAAPTYTTENGKIKIMKKDKIRKILKRSPDRADGLCLTFAPGGFLDGCDLR